MSVACIMAPGPDCHSAGVEGGTQAPPKTLHRISKASPKRYGNFAGPISLPTAGQRMMADADRNGKRRRESFRCDVTG